MTFELLQPVAYRHNSGYISFICDRYVCICFIDRPDASCRWGRYQVNLIVYSEYWHEIRSCLQQEQGQESDGTCSIAPRSSLLQPRRRN